MNPDIERIIDGYHGMISQVDAERILNGLIGKASDAAEASNSSTTGSSSASKEKPISASAVLEFISMNRQHGKDADAGRYTVDVRDYVYRIFNPVEFQTQTRKGVRRSMVLGREGYAVKATLYDKYADFIDINAFERGDVILAKNMLVDNANMELRNTRDTMMSRIIPSQTGITDFSKLVEGQKNIDVIGKVVEIGPIRYVNTLGRESQVAVVDCVITDSEAMMPVSLWGSSALMSTKMKPNDYIKIEFCSVRSRNGSIEIYASDTSRVLISKSLYRKIRKG
ncbi:MAG: hypothetical protein ACP5MZ_02740 [Candidatus Micrarchaeia archaeon]